MKRARDAVFDPRLAPYVFLTPFLAIFIVFRLWPTFEAIVISFQKWEGVDSQAWVGLSNYAATFANPRFGKALSATVLYTLGTLLILIPIPLVLAALLDSGRVVKETTFRVALFLPALTSLVVVSVVFRIVLARDGLLNVALDQVGLPTSRWLEAANLAVPSMIIMAAWRWTGVNIIYFSAALVNVPRELYEAAAIDGANGWQVFRSITVPMIRPTILFVVVLSVIAGFQLFVEPLLLWSGGNTPGDGGLSIALLVYKTAFTAFNFGQAAAMGMILAVIILVASVIQFRFFGGGRTER
jgi:arabinooligosaccharide transport system permease protein